MKSPVTNRAASVRERLYRQARSSRSDFQLLLVRYANERLLYRLAQSAHASSFALKGATLFTLWAGTPHRATRDLDLLGFGDDGVETLRAVFSDVLAIEVHDGVLFDLASLRASPIREDQQYGGVRLEVNASIATARIRVQIDVGFGDAVTPHVVEVDFPQLLEKQPFRLRAYPRETVVAEKVEAMVQLGLANTRMKDFYDVAVLAAQYSFDGALLSQAMRATFERRRTPLPLQRPTALMTDFADDRAKVVQWSGFTRKAGIQAPPTLGATIETVRAFAEPPLLAAAEGRAFSETWPAGGPWN